MTAIWESFRGTALTPANRKWLHKIERSDTILGVDGFGRRKPLILKRRDVRVVEGARLEIHLAVRDGVLSIAITVTDSDA